MGAAPWAVTATAVTAAALLGSASVAQQRATLSVPTFAAGDPRLVAALMRRPWWWAGTMASLGGLALQVLALSLGPMILVQSTMTSSIVSTTIAEWAIMRRRPPVRACAGMLLTTAGLVGVLLALSPTPGPVGAGPLTTSTLVLAGTCAATIAAVTAWARRRHGTAEALGLAVGTGLGYGVTAIELKSVGTQLALGWFVPLAHPAFYIALVLGPFSILLSQNALQQGRLVTAVVSLILIVDPLVGLAAGTIWFGERVSVTAWSLTVATISGTAMIVGIAAIQSAASRTARPEADRLGHEPARTAIRRRRTGSVL